MTRVIFRGSDTYTIADKETGYGAGASLANADYIGKIDTTTLEFDNQMILSQGAGEGLNLTKARMGLFKVSGNISGQAISFTPFQYVIGDVQGAGTSGDPYEIVEQNLIDYTNGRKSVTIEVGSNGGDNDLIYDVTGCVYTGLTISGSRGQPVSFSMDFIGKQPTKKTSGLISYTTPSAKVFVAHNVVLEDGSSNEIKVVNFSWSAKNEGQRLIFDDDSRFASLFTTGLRRYNFTYTLNFDYNDAANTLSGIEVLEYFFGAAAANTPISTNDPTALTLKLRIDEGSSTGDRDVSMDLENCYFTSWSNPVKVSDETIQVTVNGIGFAGLSEGDDKIPIRFWTN